MSKNILYHSFYCPICGNKAMDLPRKACSLREKHHRKKLYCCQCKRTVNCIECRTPNEVEEFRFNYIEGLYKEEAALELESTWVPSGLME